MSRQNRNSAKGFREVATLQTLAHGTQPRERHELASRFARLENERRRLELELGIWETRKSATEDKLANICRQIEALRPLLLDDPAALPRARAARRERRSRAATEEAGARVRESRAIAIEY